MGDMGVVHVSSEDQEPEVVTIHKHYLHTLPKPEERTTQASSWKRKMTMYRGTAPSLVLCLLLLYYTFYSTALLTTTDEVSNNHDLPGKHAYLQHMKKLFDSFAVRYNTSLDSNSFVRRLTVMGVVSELLGARGSPIRTLMPYTRGSQVLQQGDDGSFKVVVTVDPPSKGEQCFLVQGYVNYADLSGSLTKIQPVSCRERPEIWSNLRLTEWTAADPKLDPYNNGSKGDPLVSSVEVWLPCNHLCQFHILWSPYSLCGLGQGGLTSTSPGKAVILWQNRTATPWLCHIAILVTIPQEWLHICGQSLKSSWAPASLVLLCKQHNNTWDLSLIYTSNVLYSGMQQAITHFHTTTMGNGSCYTT